MIEVSVKADLDAVRRRLTSVEKEQLPFATSVALNNTVRDLQLLERQGASQDLDRPVPFTISGIQYAKSTKQNLTAKVFIEKQRAGYMRYSVYGGTRKPKRKVLIIGMTERNQYGNTPAFRTFRARLLAKKNHFEAMINGTSGIWKREGKGGSRKGARADHISLVALYTKEADYNTKFRFGARSMRGARAIFRSHFDTALARALATAR